MIDCPQPTNVLTYAHIYVCTSIYTYGQAVPTYKVMGAAKASLESACRALAVDLVRGFLF